MAFTATDLANIDAAMVTAAIDGIASVTVGGQTVAARNLDELRRLREMVAADVTAASGRAGLGIRIQTWTPYYP